MNPLIFATGSLLALFWALVSVLANVFRKQDAPPQAVRPPPRRTARKGAASPPTTPSMHPNTIQENALETVSLSSDSAGPSTVWMTRAPYTGRCSRCPSIITTLQQHRVDFCTLCYRYYNLA
ncbi:hypothetical protein BKA62DRAFT_816722 [Auriculariales sp. MPI-PUGE-AT-0066]|nr:hypothetical protein BKA62DRAFT_816722 [Auriculariales sp. MPI-PUGE-AT-0066]